ncbi:MAG: peptidase M50 [Verrucomicrobia bacterium]|nr:MAG: peptidase M50 [Verrucomicrobiota bacterium]
MQGAFRLFRVAGITVFLHWSWFVVAIIEFQQRAQRYTSPLWNALEYLALFGLVLLHEFGHALACRQVGGQAERILLWPLGGVAFVSPPQRPGAMLWSIAAGPLVNVILVPVFLALGLALHTVGAGTNVLRLIHDLAIINIVLLVFNLLPIYPLDGGQIVRSLLWFVFGRATSLLVASIIGFVGVGAIVLLAVLAHSIWFGVLAVFILLSCWRGLRQALALARLDKIPRRPGFTCANCGAAPFIGNYWLCNHCQTPFDTFATQAVCPKCQAAFDTTRCPECGVAHPLSDWFRAPPPLPTMPPVHTAPSAAPKES